MIPFSQRSIQALPWLAIAGIGAIIVWLLSPILMPFVLGALLAYLCDPLVSALNNRGVKRLWGASLAVVLVGLIVVLLTLLIVPLAWREGVQIVTRLPQLVDLLQDQIVPWINARFGTHVQLDGVMIRGWLTENWDSASQVLHNLASPGRKQQCAGAGADSQPVAGAGRDVLSAHGLAAVHLSRRAARSTSVA